MTGPMSACQVCGRGCTAVDWICDACRPLLGMTARQAAAVSADLVRDTRGRDPGLYRAALVAYATVTGRRVRLPDRTWLTPRRPTGPARTTTDHPQTGGVQQPAHTSKGA